MSANQGITLDDKTRYTPRRYIVTPRIYEVYSIYRAKPTAYKARRVKRPMEQQPYITK